MITLAKTPAAHPDLTAENAAYLPALLAECQRVGLALHLTDDPAVDLPEIKTMGGIRTVIARADEVGVALDDVKAIGRCITCNTELDDTAVVYAPANAVPGFSGCKDMTGALAKTCRPCVDASGLPLTAVQRGPEWMLRYGCTPWCVNDHTVPASADWHSTAPTETSLLASAVDSSGYSDGTDNLPWMTAQVVVSNDLPQAYGRHTSVWLGYGVHLAELTPGKAREALDSLRAFVARLEPVVDFAAQVAADDFPGDPEIARLDREAEDRHAHQQAAARTERAAGDNQ